ncbi:MAG: 3-dehydroquinate synthase [Flavobacterium sp.]|nr:MAG: 3-dehydroquinate synthase [Flavobacterium sp.]
MKEKHKNINGVYCNSNSWEALEIKVSKLNPSKIFILVDENTREHCLPLFLNKNRYNSDFEILEISSGELNKNIETCLKLWNQLSDKVADRNSLIINLGGGVITDMGGFVASTFKRGIAFINIPTTLLSMVDASIGGKNGVDLGMLKNQIGIIRNPEMVLIDTGFLKTLANHQITSGYAEMLKHGLIHSTKYWNEVKAINETNIEKLEDLLWKSVLIKNEVITEDPFEKGIRKTLNYGHTLGHAIESYCLKNTNTKTLLHGEAVAIGMILATYISNKLIDFPEETLNEINYHILKKFPRTTFDDSAVNEIISLLKYDKKNDKGKVLFVLLKDIGLPEINCEVPNKLIIKAFEYYKNYK